MKNMTIRGPDQKMWRRKHKKEIPDYRARRWVAERIHSWLNRFRRLLIRWEEKIKDYFSMLHFACSWITFRAAGLFE